LLRAFAKRVIGVYEGYEIRRVEEDAVSHAVSERPNPFLPQGSRLGCP
jgi:hypothetical protein